MDYNIFSNLQIGSDCTVVNEVVSQVYYSHLVNAVISLLFGIFVFWKSRKSLAGKILFVFSISYALRLILDIDTWVFYDRNRLSLISWAFVDLLDPIFFLICLYFVYVFIDNKDISIYKKIIIGLLALPAIILTPTRFSIEYFDIQSCNSVENENYLKYILYLEIFVTIWIALILIKRYIYSNKEKRRKVLQLGIGIIVFLFSYFAFSYIANWQDTQGDPMAFVYELYGFYGVAVFIGILSYLVIKYEAFDIKVIAAQFLIVATWIGVFSQFFIVQEFSNQVLTGITLAFVTIFGYMLFKSIREEVKASEELSLASRKLAGLNAKLEELDRAKSEFISIASHQLRTPLTSVKGFTSLILDNTFGRVPVSQKTAVEKVFVNNEKLCLLVEDMLNASRLEAGRLEYELEEADIVPVVSSTVEVIKLYAKSKKLKLVLKKPTDKLLAIIDQRKVSEIISNLIDNAIKYTPKGSVTVSIEKFQKEQKIGKFENSTTTNGDWGRVSVTDSGVGMDAKQLEGIFDKFKGGADSIDQESETANNKRNILDSSLHGNDKKTNNSASNGSYVAGTGLGVYISRQMAHAMGGRLYATSPGKGKGSTFILELPLVKK